MAHVQLTWSDYLTKISNSFITHQADGLFTDVTLVSDDNHQVSAHRLVLCAGSEYFRNILEDKKHPHPMLCLDGISSGDLNNILDYIYKGELLISRSSLASFLKIARKLKCSGLNGIKSQQGDYECYEEIQDDTELFQDSDNLNIEDTTNMTKENEGAIDISTESFYNDFIKESPVVFASIAESSESKSEDKHVPQETNFTNNIKMPNSYTELKEMTKTMFTQDPNGRFQCSYCQKSDKNPHRIMEHASEKHINNLELKCNCCENVFATMKGLRQHKRTIKSKASNPLIKIKVHEERIGTEGMNIDIPETEHKFQKHAKLIENAKDVELEETNDVNVVDAHIENELIVIKEEDDSKNYIDGHSKKVNVLERNSQKEITASKMLSANQYQKETVKGRGIYERKERLSVPPSHCKVEGQTFSLIALKQMTRKLYTEQLNGKFQCNNCPKSASKRSHIWEHTQRHIDNLEFECFCCGKIFSTTPDLRRHQLKVNRKIDGFISHK